MSSRSLRYCSPNVVHQMTPSTRLNEVITRAPISSDSYDNHLFISLTEPAPGFLLLTIRSARKTSVQPGNMNWYMSGRSHRYCSPNEVHQTIPSTVFSEEPHTELHGTRLRYTPHFPSLTPASSIYRVGQL